MDIYLDNAATSHPKPKTVTEAVIKALTEENANPGRGGHKRAIRAAERIFEARERLALLLNAADPFEIAFQFNCTDALNLAVKGSLNSGDHVIASSAEHNSVLRVLGEKLKRQEIEVTFIDPVDNGRVDPASYAKAIRKNTALMILTHASNVTGALQPVNEVGTVARLNGIRYLVDGAQAMGETNTDVNKIGCDLYAFAGHKALLGPQGTGGLYIKSGTHLDSYREGGTGSSSESIYQPEEIPERYESGTLNLPGIAGLFEGAEYVLENRNMIEQKIRTLSQMLYSEIGKIQGVTMYSPDNMLFRCGIVSFNIADYPSAFVAEQLNESGICVRGGLHCAPLMHRFLGTEKRGSVRASVGAFNTEEEILAFIEQIRRICKNAGTA